MDLFEQYDLCTPEGAIVVGLEGDTALVVDPEAGAAPQRIPLDKVMIAEVYSEEDIEPLSLELPASLARVLAELSALSSEGG